MFNALLTWQNAEDLLTFFIALHIFILRWLIVDKGIFILVMQE